MPLSDEDFHNSQRRVERMFMETISSFRLIEKNAEELFGKNSDQIKAAISEYIDDFIDNTKNSGEKHPEELIYDDQVSKEIFQSVGFYGAQLDLKERQVQEANSSMQEFFTNPSQGIFRRLFKKWIDIINNFLGSLVSATGAGEALKELKDCLRDELPEDDE